MSHPLYGKRRPRAMTPERLVQEAQRVEHEQLVRDNPLLADLSPEDWRDARKVAATVLGWDLRRAARAILERKRAM